MRFGREENRGLLPGHAAYGPGGSGEGFGLVFLDAAAHSLPPVAGRAGGSSEAIEDGVTGTVVDGESTRDVAAAIVGLLADAPRAREMGDAGRRRVLCDVSSEAFARSWDDVLRSLRHAGQRRRAIPTERSER